MKAVLKFAALPSTLLVLVALTFDVGKAQTISDQKATTINGGCAGWVLGICGGSLCGTGSYVHPSSTSNLGEEPAGTKLYCGGSIFPYSACSHCLSESDSCGSK